MLTRLVGFITPPKKMFNVEHIVQTLGLLGVIALVFAESGLLIGFFLPGDSLLFTAGFLASAGYMSIFVLAGLSFVAAVVGDSTGYYIGRKGGPVVFKEGQIEQAHRFFERHGEKAIILARFIPVIRTLVPTAAGVGKFEYKKFIRYNLIGGALWGAGMPLAGYFLGRSIPNIDHYLLPIIILIIVISLIPTALHLTRKAE